MAVRLVTLFIYIYIFIFIFIYISLAFCDYKLVNISRKLYFTLVKVLQYSCDIVFILNMCVRVSQTVYTHVFMCLYV